MFCSGYFYKTVSEKNVLKYIKRKICRLLIPLYAWNFIYGLIVAGLSTIGFRFGVITWHNFLVEPLITGHQFILNLAGWFVIPLFIVQMVYLLIRKLIYGSIYREYIIILILFILGMLGVYLSNCGFNEGWLLTVNRVLHFLPFYGFGYFYKTKIEKNDVISNYKYFSIILLISLFIIYKNGGPLSYIQSFARYNNSYVFTPFFVGLLGIAFWLRVSKILEPAIGKSHFVNIIADNSYGIMIHHLSGCMLLKAVFSVLSLVIELNPKFDWGNFYTNVWYYYLPHDNTQFYILYLIVGIGFGIFMQKVENTFKNYIIKYKKACF